MVTSNKRSPEDHTSLNNGLAGPFLAFIDTPQNRTRILDLVDFHPDDYNLLASRTCLESIKSDLKYIGRPIEQNLEGPIGRLTSSISEILDGRMDSTV